MHLGKPAIFFSILLTAPTSLFINALPADGLISSRTTSGDVDVRVFNLVDCTSTEGVAGVTVPLTRNTCAVLPTTLVQILSYQSGKAVFTTLDTTKLDCTIYFYRGQQCGGLSIGQAQVDDGLGTGTCTNFNLLPQVYPNLALGANSAKFTCTSKPI